MTRGNSSEQDDQRTWSPMRTFWIALVVSSIVLVLFALLIGRYGVDTPVSLSPRFKEISSVNVAIWSLVITSVVGLAGSITAIAIASAANRAQELSTRLQAIEVYHNHPAYEKARRVSDAYVAVRSTLRLIVTGLEESRNHAVLHGAANPRPTINRWRTFAGDIHRALFESELYTYLLATQPDKTRLIAHSVATLLATADDLEVLMEPHVSTGAAPGGTGSADSDRALFVRNAMAYVASGELLKVMRRAPSIEELFRSFGGEGPVPYIRKVVGDRNPEASSDTGLEAIRGLSSEALVRMHGAWGYPASTTSEVARSLADKLRHQYDWAAQAALGEDDPAFHHMVYLDFWLPCVDRAISRAIELALQPDVPGCADGHSPPVASRAVRFGTLDQCVEHLSDAYKGSFDRQDSHDLRSLTPLFPEVAVGSNGVARHVVEINSATRNVLDRISDDLAKHHADTLFVFEIRNELQQPELFYLASRLPRSLVIWTGWPFIPNENVAFKTLLRDREFTRTDRPGHFPFRHPIIFTGVLPLLSDPQVAENNTATRTVHELCGRPVVVSDL